MNTEVIEKTVDNEGAALLKTAAEEETLLLGDALKPSEPLRVEERDDDFERHVLAVKEVDDVLEEDAARVDEDDALRVADEVELVVGVLTAVRVGVELRHCVVVATIVLLCVDAADTVFEDPADMLMLSAAENVEFEEIEGVAEGDDEEEAKAESDAGLVIVAETVLQADGEKVAV